MGAACFYKENYLKPKPAQNIINPELFYERVNEDKHPQIIVTTDR